MKCYKLVTQDYQTRPNEANCITWRPGEWHEAQGSGTELCSEDVLHSYAHPKLAMLCNSIHADIQRPRMIECEASEVVAKDGLKQGHKRMMMVVEVPVPVMTDKDVDAAMEKVIKAGDAMVLLDRDDWTTLTDDERKAIRAKMEEIEAQLLADLDLP